jgi:hypothetical protein
LKEILEENLLIYGPAIDRRIQEEMELEEEEEDTQY